jgi:hypothetical protein
MLRIEVQVKSSQDRKDIKGTSTDTVTQNKTLNISVIGKAKNPETRIGKWMVYGRDLKTHAITMLGSDEFKLDIPIKGEQKVESKNITTTSTPEHTEVSGTGKRMKYKKIEAEGTKYLGFGVQITDGEKLVSEYFDPKFLKK